MRAIAVLLVAVAVSAGCSGHDPNAAPNARPYGAEAGKVGAVLSVLGWKIGLSNVRWDGPHLLVDIDGAPSEAGKAHARAEELRFGLYGALAHPLEANGIGSCREVANLAIQPLTAPTPDRLAGTVCLGPLENQNEVRGVYVYSPLDRIPGTTATYPAAFPVGVPPTNPNDTGGLLVKTASVEAWRADGSVVTQPQLGDPAAFTGNGYMLLGLDAWGVAARYRDESARRGGPMMLVVAPSLPDRDALSQACLAHGSSVLVLPDAKLDAVHLAASLCTQGEINQALLYASVSVVGTHAAVWTTRD